MFKGILSAFARQPVNEGAASCCTLEQNAGTAAASAVARNAAGSVAMSEGKNYPEGRGMIVIVPRQSTAVFTPLPP